MGEPLGGDERMRRRGRRRRRKRKEKKRRRRRKMKIGAETPRQRGIWGEELAGFLHVRR